MTLARSHSKRLYPAHLAVALAGRLSTCPLYFTAKRLHSAAQGRRRSSSTSWRGERLEETALVPVLTFVAPVSHFAFAVYFSLRTLCQVGDPAPGVRYRDSCRLAEGQFSP